MSQLFSQNRQIHLFEGASGGASSADEAQKISDETVKQIRESGQNAASLFEKSGVFENNAKALARDTKEKLYKLKDTALGKILKTGGVSTESGYGGKHYDRYNYAVQKAFDEELAKVEKLSEELAAKQEAVVRMTELRDAAEEHFRTAYNTLVVLQKRQERLFKIQTHTENGFIKSNAMSIDGAKKVLEYDKENDQLLQKAKNSANALDNYAKESSALAAQIKIPFIREKNAEIGIRLTQSSQALQSRQEAQAQCNRLTEGIRLIFIEGVANKDPKILTTGDYYIKTAKKGANKALLSEITPQAETKKANS